MIRFKRALKKLLLFFAEYIQATTKFVETPRILMYHRINSDPSLRSIHPDHFEQHLRVLQKRYSIVPLDHLLRPIKTAKTPLILTFDDGYADFYRVTWPLLKKYSQPATLFVATDFAENNQWLWPDRLRFILDNASLGDHDENLWEIHADALLLKSVDEIDQSLIELAQRHNVQLPKAPCEPFTATTWQQLLEMQNEGLNVQCHTRSHPILSRIDHAQRLQEIIDAKVIMEQKLSKKINAFCYPNGQIDDIDQTIVELVAKAGFSLGFMAQNYASKNPLVYGRIAASEDTTELLWRLMRNQKMPSPDYFHYAS